MLTISPPQGEAASTHNVPAKQKRLLARRSSPDRSQEVRRSVQFAFLLLNVCIGARFVLWVRYFESRGSSPYAERPAGVDGWLPIAGLMNMRYFLVAHHIPAIHPAAMVLVCVFVLRGPLVKKSFCSWLCPVGTVSEYGSMDWRIGFL